MAAIVQSAVVTCYIVDAHGIIEFENETAGRSFDYQPGARTGANASAYVHPEDLAEVQALFEGLLARPGGNETAVLRWKRDGKPGDWAWMHAGATNLLHDPAVGGVVVVAVNVTERYEAERALRASEHRFRSLVQNSSDAFIVVDAIGHFLYISDSSLRVLGRKHEQGCRRNLLDFVHPGDMAEAARQFSDVLASSTDDPPVTHESRVVDAAGRVRWVEVSAVNRLADPHVGGIVLNVRDITERHAAEAELSAAQQRLQTQVEIQQMLLARAEVRAQLPEIVRLLQESAGVSRVVFAERDPDGADFSVIAEHCAPGVPSRLGPNGEPVPARTYPPALGPLGAGQVVEIRRAELSGEMAAGMDEVGTRSAIQAPVLVRGDLRGLLLYQRTNVDEGWNPAEKDHLRSVAGALAMALEREESERSAAAERLWRGVILESMLDGMAAADAQGRIMFVNPAAEHILGRPAAKLVGRQLGSFFEVRSPAPGDLSPPHPLGPGADGVGRVLGDGKPLRSMRHIWTLPEAGVTPVHVATSTLPLRDAAGKITGVVRLFRDLTEEDRRQAEIIRAGRMDGLAMVAAGIAHDFNNLLTSLNGNVSLALMDLAQGDADRVLTRLSEAEAAGRRARELTGQLLTFTKGGLPLKRASSLGEILRDSVTFALHGSSVRHELDLDPALPELEADPAQLHRVLHNLALNATEAMPTGGRLRVSARPARPEEADPADRLVAIVFEDDGPGIPPEVLPRVFEPFFSTKPSGSGLGLAAAHAIVRNHRGRLECESPSGGGAVFRILWPAAACSDAPGASPASAPPPPVRIPRRVLVVDDDPTVRLIARRMLGVLGHDAEEAADGTVALSRLQSARAEGRRFDLALIDLTIPGGPGGLVIVQEARAEDPDLRCIVSSGYIVDDIRAEYLALGFSAILAKPYQMMELEAAITEALGSGAALPA